ncbi:Beta-1,3-galactosyltransferase brn [Orchesella cincta]|uniref:Hexosyltransferase n=1 Tax=Orchesella cincta TaxID=48709 RepID=A0A1D2MUB9_ORCCI|nr:Beta-1,3-galactosyltransferase brn [Orchesella cincta]
MRLRMVCQVEERNEFFHETNASKIYANKRESEAGANVYILHVILEKDFESDFSYPLDVDNFPALIENFRNGDPVEFEPINRLYSRPKFLEKADSSCDDFQLMLIMIKSAPQNIKRRNVIRSTWGHPQYLKNISNLIRTNKLVTNSNRLSLPKNHQEPNAVFKLVFLIGLISDDENDKLVVESDVDNVAQVAVDTSKSLKDTLPQDGVTEKQQLERKIRKESKAHKDIVRIDTVDSYSNNTFKTMMGIRWASEICTDFEYALLVDDDMYISIKNLLLFIESPATYPDGYAEDSDSETIGQIVDANRLFAGKVLFTKPIRQRIGSYSKWYLSLEEYPYNYFPRYMPAAAVIMSKQVVEDFYYASYYTKHFRFDDVFLGIMAYKMNIIPFSCSYFYVCHTEGGKCPGILTKKKRAADGSYEEDEVEELTLVEQMEHVIAKHGLNPDQLTDLWRELTLSGRI